MIGIVYHPDFNKYDLGLEHPLVGDKPGKTIELIKQKKLERKIDFFQPEKATEEDLIKAHTKKYIEIIKNLSKTGGMLSLDTPAPKGIFEIASLAAGGSKLCGKKVFEEYKIMMNPLGGFHHAGKNTSSGFCFFNDIAVTIEYLRFKHKITRFLVLDTDVHHGNGTQEIYNEDPSVLNISIHQDGKTLYPGTGKISDIGKNQGIGYSVNLPLPPGTGSKPYLNSFEELIPPLIEQFKPEVIIWQSGVDTHHSDPLADINLSYQTFYTISEHMKKYSEKTCEKLIVLFGGGYNSEASVKSYYNIICALLEIEEHEHEFDRSYLRKYHHKLI